ncbi:MAG: septation protein A [SAR86 cluster bacterium]|uniref:Inner membrane-spanning protein YciB n=1 Tax=SAR86 cluster bacterium TaxID=2030880 RepID=A0A2A5BAL2_9GAMM|nr:MAG: septation protein A [SAR86 cluster bacterium]
MKQLIDYIPLLVFFSVWAMDERAINIAGFEHSIGGVFSAAEFLLAASIIVYASLFISQKRLDKFQWITLGAVILFCLPTIIFRNIEFLKWKAPIVNWIFATVFLGSRFFSDKPAIEHMMGHAVNAPKEVWFRLNTIWIIYFIILGAVNLTVAFTLSEAHWIQFKVFGNLIITFVFIMGQMPILSKYIEIDEDENEDSQSKESVQGDSE